MADIDLPEDFFLSQTLAGASSSPGLAPALRLVVEHRVNVVVNRLVSLYRNGTLTGDRALLAIAEVSSLRSLVLDVEGQVKQGQRAER